MQKILVIFAHPDDEGAIGGTLAYYARRGVEIKLICATRGEVGEISDSSLATPETLPQVRQKELERACDILGIQHLEFLNHRDSGMAETAENHDPRALIQIEPAVVIGQITQQIRQYQPDIVITFEPFGWYGHPDHQAISRWTTAAYLAASDAKQYESFGPAWQAKRLFYAVLPFSKFQTMIQSAVAAGHLEEEDVGFDIPQDQQLATEAAVTHQIDIHDLFDVKQQAMQAHQTQFGEDNFFSKIPRQMMLEASGREYFIQVYPTPSQRKADEGVGTDIFEGV